MKRIDYQLFIWLIIAFIFSTIIGTVSHELGHYFVAKCLGYNAHISYAFTTWSSPNLKKSTNQWNEFLIIFGGPLQTILTGTIGLLFLYKFRKNYQKVENLGIKQWIIIFISLFWLRQPANFAVWLGMYIFSGHFQSRSDESLLAQYLQIPIWTISGITAIIGSVVLSIIVFKIIPISKRLTFILAGFLGGIAGYILWLHLIGKILMP